MTATITQKIDGIDALIKTLADRIAKTDSHVEVARCLNRISNLRRERLQLIHGTDNGL